METTTSTNATKLGRAFGYHCLKSSDSAAEAEALAQRCRTYLDRLSQRPGSSSFQWINIVTDSTEQQKMPLLKRPRGRYLDAMLQAGDMVIFASMDRSAKSSRDLIDIVQRWQSKGVAVHFADDAIAEATMELPVGEQQRQQELTLAVMIMAHELRYRCNRENRARKRPLQYQGGYVPAGFRVRGHPGHRWLEFDAKQIRVIKEIVRLRDEGLSWWRVSDQIEEMLAREQDRKLRRRWQKRAWSQSRCCNAYKTFADVTGIKERG